MKTLPALLLLFAGAGPLAAQTWTQTMAPVTNWQSVASSADGRVLVAGSGRSVTFNPTTYVGGIWVSTNWGHDWFQADPPGANFYTSVAISADGSTMAATDFTRDLFSSSDFGSHWTLTNTPTLLRSLCMSGDGILWDASDGNGNFFQSTNGGATWTSNRITLVVAPSAIFAGLAISSDASRVAAVALNTTAVYTSADYGATWQSNNVPNSSFITIASSADGKHLIAAGNPQVSRPSFVSADYGASWTSNNLPAGGYRAVAMSADGARAAVALASVSYSTNGGANWATNATPPPLAGVVAGMASSAGGARMAAVFNAGNAQPGGIFILEIPRQPQVNVTLANAALNFSWLAPSTNMAVQQCADLASSNWVTLTNAPALNFTNLHQEVVLPLTNTSAFYRLSAE